MNKKDVEGWLTKYEDASDWDTIVTKYPDFNGLLVSRWTQLRRSIWSNSVILQKWKQMADPLVPDLKMEEV